MSFVVGKKYIVALVIALAGLTLAFVVNAQIRTIIDDFETYTLGDLTGQGGWDLSPLGAVSNQVTVGSGCFTGTQCAAATQGTSTSANSRILTLDFDDNFDVTFQLVASTSIFPAARFMVGVDDPNVGAIGFFYNVQNDTFQSFECQGTTLNPFNPDTFPHENTYEITIQYTGELKQCFYKIENLDTGAIQQFTMEGTGTEPLTRAWFRGARATAAEFVQWDNFKSSIPQFGFEAVIWEGTPRITSIDVTAITSEPGSMADVDFIVRYDNVDGTYRDLSLALFSVESDTVHRTATTTAESGVGSTTSSFNLIDQNELWELWAFLAVPSTTPFAPQTPIYRRVFSTDLSLEFAFLDTEQQPCSFTNLEGCLVNAGRTLFQPDPDELNGLLSATQNMRTKFPFGYVNEALAIYNTALGGRVDYTVAVGADVLPEEFDTDIVIFSTEGIEDNLFLPFDFFRTLMIYAVYAFFALFAYRKAADFRMRDV